MTREDARYRAVVYLALIVVVNLVLHLVVRADLH